MIQPELGIMTVKTRTHPPFPEKDFFIHMIRAGQKEKIRTIVFHPDQINFQLNTVNGFFLGKQDKWATGVFSLPKLIYDRCFYLGTEYNKLYRPYVIKLLNQKNVRFLGIGLKGKWQMYQAVSKHATLSSFLPPTEIYTGPKQLWRWLKKYTSIILKPINGSLGIGVIKVTKHGAKSIHVEGRSLYNTPFSISYPSFGEFVSFFQSFIKKWKYLIQPYLSLKTKSNIPFDIRLLVQKNGEGNWTMTGKAVRMGTANSITSNLHGGGKAYSYDSFMADHYSEHQSRVISSQLEIVGKTLPEYLEKQHGPLVELGIDIGIDTALHVWLIEVNSKPGREIFHQTQDKEAILKAELNPLYYAKHLIQLEGV